MEINIEYKEETVTVEGFYTQPEPECFTTPGMPPDFEIQAVWFCQVNILGFLEDSQVLEIEKLILENLFLFGGGGKKN